MTQVAVLGSGPAGLLAALAVEQAGHEPFIIAKGDKSKMFGAMYLHQPIPGLTGDIMVPDFDIEIIKSGVREGYAENVYGDPEAPVSWDVIPEVSTPAWDLHAAYDKLWERYGSKIRKVEIDEKNMGSVLSNFSLVLCSIPASAICSRFHMFDSQGIWVVHGEGNALITGVNDNNMMYYNGYTPDGKYGMKGFNWYRFSQIKRYQAWEFSHEPPELTDWEAEIREVSRGYKPIKNDCDCWVRRNPHFVRIGRFGKWEKGVLTHHAYHDASEAARALL